LGGNSTNSEKIFALQKKIIRIMAAAQLRTCCGSLFKQLEILIASCQYILWLMYFIINNQEILHTNSSVHNINTGNHHLRQNSNLSFSKKYILSWHKNFQQYHLVCLFSRTIRQNLKEALRKYLTHTILLLCRWIFLCVTVIYNTVFV
jgi:hypothetical protein